LFAKTHTSTSSIYVSLQTVAYWQSFPDQRWELIRNTPGYQFVVNLGIGQGRFRYKSPQFAICSEREQPITLAVVLLGTWCWAQGIRTYGQTTNLGRYLPANKWYKYWGRGVCEERGFLQDQLIGLSSIHLVTFFVWIVSGLQYCKFVTLSPACISLLWYCSTYACQISHETIFSFLGLY
jgi:hypothetical protein